MNKILYRYENGRHEFYALIGVPEKPRKEFSRPHPMKASAQDIYRAQLKEYTKQLESIKSAAPRIVNWNELQSIKAGQSQHTKEKLFLDGVIITPGDIFDWPEGYGFVEQMLLGSGEKVIRLVKQGSEPNSYKIPHEVRNDTVAAFASEEDLLIYSHFYEKGKREPEASESQDELFKSLLFMCDTVAEQYRKQSIMQSFTIQRKKP